MKKIIYIPAILLLLLIALIVSYITKRDEIHVATASSLAHLTEPTKLLFEEIYPQCSVSFSIASSGALYAQIEQGAPFDFFISANQHWIKKAVKDSEEMLSNVQILAQGELWLWLEKDTIINMDQEFVIANPITAPYGAAAKTWLDVQGFWDVLEKNGKIIIAASAAKIPFSITEGGIEQAIVPKALLSKLPAPTHQEKLAGNIVYYMLQLTNGECQQSWKDFLRLPDFASLLEQRGFK